jgi:membrane protein DedA with SNARE-associated domain
MVKHFILQWVVQYSYVGIFSLLMLGIVGLPVPDEFLLTFVGFLVFRNQLHLAPAVLAAFLGAACGISLSYLLGRTVGLYLVERFGGKIGIHQAQIRRVHDWFERIGGWSLTFGYYVPGVRHLTAYVAGTAGYELPRFALFAYSGAAIWAGSFIALGYYLGDGWNSASRTVREATRICMWLLLVGVIIYGLWLWAQNKRKQKD